MKTNLQGMVNWCMRRVKCGTLWRRNLNFCKPRETPVLILWRSSCFLGAELPGLLRFRRADAVHWADLLWRSADAGSLEGRVQHWRSQKSCYYNDVMKKYQNTVGPVPHTTSTATPQSNQIFWRTNPSFAEADAFWNQLMSPHSILSLLLNTKASAILTNACKVRESQWTQSLRTCHFRNGGLWSVSRDSSALNQREPMCPSRLRSTLVSRCQKVRG